MIRLFALQIPAPDARFTLNCCAIPDSNRLNSALAAATAAADHAQDAILVVGSFTTVSKQLAALS